MIAPSINLHTFARTIREWAKGTGYYIEHPNIIEIIKHNGRTFYSRNKYVDSELTDEIIQLHLSKKITVSIPIIKKDIGKAIFFIYDGEGHEKFIHLLKHIVATHELDNYNIFRGKRESQHIVVIRMPEQSINYLNDKAMELSELLERKMAKNWKILPNPSLPESYNIVTIPHNTDIY